MNPNKILGFKHDDAAKNFKELKNHPFFEGVDFDKTKPPQVNKEFRQEFDDVYAKQLKQRFLADYQNVADIQQISQDI